jgi:hypothetical protein
MGQRLYGRDRETRELCDKLTSRRTVLLHAPSGAGKTSLIQAGLWPHLAAARLASDAPVRVHAQPRPGVTPANRYVWSVLAQLEEHAPAERRLGDPQLLEARLVDYFDPERRPPRDRWAELLVLDQFEEILTLDPSDLAIKADFFAQLGAALRVTPLRLLVSMRTDYIGALEPYLRVVPEHLGNRMFMDFLSPDAAVRSVQGPTAEIGVTFDDEAARALVKDLSTIQVLGDDGKPARTPGPYVEPVHLQVACEELWLRKAPSFTGGGGRITVSDVLSLGGVDDALANYYDRKLADIAGGPARERVIRDFFDGELITGHGVRGQVQARALDAAVVKALLDAYLIREEVRRGARWYELAHDRLIVPVQASNRKWRAEKLTDVQRQAGEWARLGRRPELLIRDEAALRRAEGWAKAEPALVTAADRELIEASRAALNEARREAMRREQLGTNLADLGWGVVFPRGAPALVRDALAELLEHRRAEASAKREGRYRELSGSAGYQPGESAAQFLARHGVGSGPPNPDRVPTYLLLVGGPEEIPFEVQYDLDLQYKVGRVAFDDVADYAVYARSVVTSETMPASLPRRAAIVAPPGKESDLARRLLGQRLVDPLVDELTTLVGDWSIELVADAGSHARLAGILGGDEPATLLLFAGHGLMGREPARQGALVTGVADGAVTSFGASDLPPDAALAGTVAFLFAACSAGTPAVDNYRVSESRRLAAKPFVSPLAQRLLAAPRGGALAVIGHVDATYTMSFTEGTVADFAAFASTMRGLMTGTTVGAAVDYFNHRYAALAAQLVGSLLTQARGPEVDAAILATIDARNYIVLGDPAARLPVDDRPVAAEWPVIPAVDRAPWQRDAGVLDSDGDRDADVAIALTGLDALTGQPALPPFSRAALASLLAEQRAGQRGEVS